MKPLKKIMIVDDDEVSNYIFTKLVEISGFGNEITCHEKAGDAYAYLKNNSSKPDEMPEVIFLDLLLFDMSGWDFLDKYESLPESIKGKIYVVILTTSIYESDREKAIKYPSVKKFLTKPITLDGLKEIRETLNHK
jgi:CheY-like chemotaxis protein